MIVAILEVQPNRCSPETPRVQGRRKPRNTFNGFTGTRLKTDQRLVKVCYVYCCFSVVKSPAWYVRTQPFASITLSVSKVVCGC